MVLSALIRQLKPEFGRRDRIRTCDLLVPNETRYQLRYTRMGKILLKKFYRTRVRF